ncbi:B3 domain-containing transcription factor VRN1-like isoform X2 [Gastrolobium bilobum]|uniref:B3 domain-containing transcription factor VRN1-like isoform X2 n=1 Tax=Gastrolobium bilobum TaxID=150636 RepID=UPI002AB27635|nr:B3 domain-containing transcription factor VRN1-like isoform X2 [Gastrolobium bilobum]
MTYHCNAQNKHTIHTPILFFKIILRTSLQDGKLKLPNNFTRRYGGNMPNPMFLKPPDGTEWEVFWTKKDGDIWLQKGWKEFATYYSLDHGHLVLFEYKKTSQFEDNLDQINDDSVKISDELPSCHETRQKSPISCPRRRNKLRTGTSGDVDRRSADQNLSQHVQIEGQSTNFDKSKFASVKKESDEDMVCTTEQDNLDQIHDDSVKSFDERPPCRMARQKAPMSCPRPCKRLRTGTSGDVERRSTLRKLPQHVQIKEEMDGTAESLIVEQLTSKRTEALKKAKTFRSKTPSFTIVMKPSYLDKHRLHIPFQFAEKYLKKKEGNIHLQGLDGGTWHCDYRLGKINAGWKKFVSDNNLKVGDVCLFELTKSQGLSFKVQIFRLAEEPHSLPVQGWKTTPCPLTNGALKEAKKFTSENPIFTFNFSLGNRPNVPRSFIREHFNEKSQIVKLQFRKKLWPVKFYYRPHKVSISGKFSSGWSVFARESKMVDGDVCLFELINREEAVLDVHIFRSHS